MVFSWYVMPWLLCHGCYWQKLLVVVCYWSRKYYELCIEKACLYIKKLCYEKFAVERLWKPKKSQIEKSASR
jgi:hypothetical protein